MNEARGLVLAPPNLHRIERPHALKIPARRAEYSLTENVASPFQAEPTQEIQNHAGSFRLNSFERQISAIQPYDLGHASAVLSDKLFRFFLVAANFLDLPQSGIGSTVIAQFPNNQ